MADIEAKVWYEAREKVFLNRRIATETGNTERKHRLKLGEFTINLNKPFSNFQKYDTMSSSRQMRLFSNFYLPIILETTTHTEYIYEDVTFTEEEVTATTIDRITESLLEKIENEENIVNKQVNIYPGIGYMEIEVILEVLENIGTKEKI